MKSENIVKRHIEITNHEIIINGIRFTLAQIMKAKKDASMLKRKENKKTTFLVFNLDNARISIE